MDEFILVYSTAFTENKIKSLKVLSTYMDWDTGEVFMRVLINDDVEKTVLESQYEELKTWLQD